jgi:TolA-binding protein/peroxiredoxin
MRQRTFRQHDCAVNDRGLAQCEGALRARFSRSAGKAGVATFVGLICSFWATGVAEAQAQKQTPESLLRYTPVQKSVEYDTPEAADIPKCTVALEQGSYVVSNPANQVLRKFTDANGDGFPDMYRYYHLGLEVYREIDTNGDFKAKKATRPDQYRWMNWGGTRWGLDPNEDGKIDSWKVISAQESARVAVEALINGDLQALSTVMINDADIKTLGLAAAKAKEIQAATADLAKLAQAAVSDSKVLNSRSQWVRFDPPLPGLILAEQLGTSGDLTVYENAMAYVQNGEKLDLISVGEMVQVGDAWKLLQVPAPISSGNNVVQVGGLLMTPGLPGKTPGDAATPEMSAEMQKLLADLQKIDEASPQPDAPAQAFTDYNVARANVSEKLIGLSRNDEERQQWIQQFTDSLSTATQSGLYSEGLPRLIALQDAAKSNQALLGYIYYRRLMAEYAVRLKNDEKVPQADAAKARELTQKWWFEQLEGYASKWPKSEDAPDAVVQLAISYELMGRIEDAKAWYAQLAKNYPETEGGVKAQGAMRRLTLTGKPLTLAGKTLQGQPLAASQFKGKVLLVVFWASYAQPFTDDLKTISEVYAKHQKAGFEILGVNMDTDLPSVAAYLKQNGITWPSLREAPKSEGQQPGDFNYGIVSVPTMFIVNKEGLVEGGITASNLEYAVDALIQGKKLEATPATEGEAEVAAPKTGAKRDSTADKTKARN